MMKILLTGANGFLGSIVRRHYTGDLITLSRANADLNIDIKQPFTLDPDLDVGMVLHAAGKAHSLPKNVKEEQLFYEVNLEGTKNICRALEGLNKKIHAFIFISTVAVYGLDAGEMINEHAERLGSTPYARSKVFAEDFLMEWSDRHDVKLSILRLPLVAGQNPPGNLGAMIKGIQTGRYLSIGRANVKKSIVWGADIVRIIPALSKIGGIYNLTDGTHPSFGQLETGISAALHKREPLKAPLWIARCLSIAGDVIGPKFPLNSDKLRKITSTLTFDDRKARKELEWQPTSVLSKIQEII